MGVKRLDAANVSVGFIAANRKCPKRVVLQLSVFE
jgi:hypothetical protein